MIKPMIRCFYNVPNWIFLNHLKPIRPSDALRRLLQIKYNVHYNHIGQIHHGILYFLIKWLKNKLLSMHQDKIYCDLHDFFDVLANKCSRGRKLVDEYSGINDLTWPNRQINCHVHVETPALEG